MMSPELFNAAHARAGNASSDLLHNRENVKKYSHKACLDGEGDHKRTITCFIWAQQIRLNEVTPAFLLCSNYSDI